MKIPVDDREVDVLASALDLLVSREDVRAEMGRAAGDLARKEHDLDRVADLYAAALEEAAGGAAVGDEVLREVSRAAADVGISADTSEAQEIARRLAEVELGN